MIGAPNSKIEKRILYTVGAPFLWGSLLWYDFKLFLSRLVPRVSVRTTPVKAHVFRCGDEYEFNVWPSGDAPDKSPPFLEFRVQRHVIDLIKLCLSTPNQKARTYVDFVDLCFCSHFAHSIERTSAVGGWMVRFESPNIMTLEIPPYGLMRYDIENLSDIISEL